MAERKDQKVEGERLTIPVSEIQDKDAFMKALHQFQYGDKEESDEGFRTLSEIASSQSEEDKDKQE